MAGYGTTTPPTRPYLPGTTITNSITGNSRADTGTYRTGDYVGKDQAPGTNPNVTSSPNSNADKTAAKNAADADSLANRTNTPTAPGGGGGGGSSGTTAAAPAIRDDGTTYTDPTAESYQAYLDAMGYLQQQGNTYDNPWGDTINGIVDAIMNRGSYQYDLNEDALYQQYRDQYINQAQMSMRDTMGQAAALTGGYGSSYGQAAGQLAYDRTMQGLNDIVPQLEQNAYNRYVDQGNEMRNNLNMAMQMDQTNYGRWMDTQNLARQDANDAYNRWITERSYNDDRQMQEQNRLMTLAAQGYTPTRTELAQAGISEDQWAYYKKMVTPTSSGGGRGGSASTTVTDYYNSTYQKYIDSGYSPAEAASAAAMATANKYPGADNTINGLYTNSTGGTSHFTSSGSSIGSSLGGATSASASTLRKLLGATTK